MASSTYLLTKRAFISLLLSLARVDQILVEVRRDSSGTQVQKACRRVFLKAHPDNGGQRRTPNGCQFELFATPRKSPTLIRKCFGFPSHLRMFFCKHLAGDGGVAGSAVGTAG